MTMHTPPKCGCASQRGQSRAVRHPLSDRCWQQRRGTMSWPAGSCMCGRPSQPTH